MKSRCCPHCNQPLPEIRLGVKLSPLKARIFDLIQRGGKDGVDKRDIFDIVYAEEKGAKLPTLKTHIYQINEVIGDEGYRIVGHSIARLVKLK
jgi:hypothetical protein